MHLLDLSLVSSFRAVVLKQSSDRFRLGVRSALTFACAVLVVSVSVTAGAEQAAQNEVLTAKAAFVSTEIKIDIKPGQPSFLAEWNYTNASALGFGFPMLVESIGSSCGCLAAKAASDKPVKTGESGTIRATFSPGNHRGLLRKSLHVRFYGHTDAVELIVEARIPSPVELSTQELMWTPDKVSDTKVIDITTGTGEEFSITNLLGVSEKLYSIRKEVVVAGSHYQLHITPLENLSPGIQTLQIRTNSRDPRDKVLVVFLRNEKPTVTGSSESKPVVSKQP